VPVSLQGTMLVLEHGPPLGPVYPTLHVQAVRFWLELFELEYTGHATQTRAVEAFAVVEYFPAPQSVHAEVPAMVLYVPMAQPEHTPPFGPVKPMLHVQACAAELAVGELEFAGHARHVATVEEPVAVEYFAASQSQHAAFEMVGLYLPGTQAMHGPPAGPGEPKLHVQAVRAELARGELELAGHARQTRAVEAPVVVEYVPAPQ